MPNISLRLAQELQCKPAQVTAAIALLDEGATVPFIARYRKEVTGGLDDGQLRLLAERLRYLRELDERRATIIAAIDEQGQLTAALRAQLDGADNKQALEDLYLPYKQKRRTKAQIAREAGLAVLAEQLLKNPQQDPEKLAASFVCEGFADTKAVLEGAKAVLLEGWGEDAALIGQLRSHLQSNGLVTSKVVKGQESAGAKFSDYFDFSEKWAAMPSHRVLAVLRGANEKVLSIGIQLPEEIENGARSKIWSSAEQRIARHVGISANWADAWLGDVIRAAWRSKLGVSLENELLSSARERAELDAIKVFSRNLKDLLLAAPAGPRCTLGLDPGLRTGVKVAVVDATGKLLATDTIYPHEPRRDWDKSLFTLKKLCDTHGVELIAIGNGTASRETEQLATELIAMIDSKKPTKVVVSEAGASVYSASELAAKEFPDLDVSIRGAVSIARRLQDPLAELVKIDPKSIGVGQYQHDVNQHELARMLDAVVEDCVNAVGVDVNTASAALLSRVSGLSLVLASNVVAYRDEYGAFKNRKALLKVPRLGGKTFELAAGFLRIMNGDNPLDASAVHPEAYPVVEKLLQKLGQDLRSTMGNRVALQAVAAESLTDAQFGLPTVKDILAELEKPGRDPRPEFKTATFAAGIEKISDLTVGMVLEGVVSNVTNFGAFVDVGVHQDGLVHISMLANTFVKDPHAVVKAGQVVKVKVLEIDVARKRIALSMRLGEQVEAKPARPKAQHVQRAASPQQHHEPSAMANAFASLKSKK